MAHLVRWWVCQIPKNHLSVFPQKWSHSVSMAIMAHITWCSRAGTSAPRCRWSAPARTPACSAAWPRWRRRRPPSPTPRGRRCPAGSGCANRHLSRGVPWCGRMKKVGVVFPSKWWRCGFTLWMTMNHVESRIWFFEVFQGIFANKNRIDQ